MLTNRRPIRAAPRAASFTRFIRSAPEKPGVPRAIRRRSTSGPTGTLRAWTDRIRSRPLMSGFGTWIVRSNRPGRSSAGSSTSLRLVAAIMMMPSFASKPSISTSSWFSVCSRSSLPPPMPTPRARPTASISSMNRMQGADFLACSNMSRTRLAPTPTNISTKSDPEMVKNGTPASPAMARASSVLPVPGGPTSSAPLGILPPRRLNFCGLRRNSTISSSSSLASSMPATSSKVTRPCFSVSSLALDLPKPMAPPLPPPCMRFMKKIHTPISRINGSQTPSIDMKPLLCCLTTRTSTPCWISRSLISSPIGRTVAYCSPLVPVMATSSPSIVTALTWSFCTRSMKSE